MCFRALSARTQLQVVSAFDARSLGAEIDSEAFGAVYLAPFRASSPCVPYPALDMVPAEDVTESQLGTSLFRVRVPCNRSALACHTCTNLAKTNAQSGFVHG